MMTTTLKNTGIMGPIGTEGRYIPVMIAISVLNAFGAMFLMNIIL
ncbi:hypothetical protein [Vibrio celticus]